MMNIYLVIILMALIGNYALQNISDYLNVKSLDTRLPDEFQGFYDEEKYKKAQEYTIIQTRFDYISSTIYILLLLPFILLGGFNYVDEFVRVPGEEQDAILLAEPRQHQISEFPHGPQDASHNGTCPLLDPCRLLS